MGAAPDWPAGWPAGWPEGVGRVVLAEVDSTMEEAARRADALARPSWIMAARQTAARGRRGRTWEMPLGNFAATLVMRPAGGPAEAALRSFAAALALHEACTAATGDASRFALKWPNDVLMDGRKLAGILLERRAETLLVGIGVNLATAPAREALEPGAVPPAALAEAGARIAPAAFLDLLAPAFARHEAVLSSQGFEPVRAAWLARAARLGQRITARTGAETLEGRFETVDAAGHLVLATEHGRRAVAAAEVFL
jgi:BirA family biotin operon repressor/biotin-[acetyl-CoA-carboxylase] ligase